MIFQHKLKKHIEKEPSRILLIFFLLLLMLWEYIFVIKGWAYYFPPIFYDKQLGTNGADMLQTILLIVVIKEGVGLAEKKVNFFTKSLIGVSNFIGERTLYIFLYHMFFLQLSKTLLPFDSIWLKRIVWGTLMIGGPIVLEYVFALVKKWCKDNIYYGNR